MPSAVRFQGRSLDVIDWHCPGRDLGTGGEEHAPAFEVSIGRVGGHVCRFADGEVAADTAGLLMVNAGDAFRPVRRARGIDRRTVITVSEAAVRELAGARAPRFPHHYLPLTARAALSHDALLDPSAEPLASHEHALAIVGEAFASALTPRSVSRPIRDAVHAVRATLAARYADRIRLDELAAGVGLSPWHLSRSFRAVLGVRLHDYQTRVRLLAVLERMRGAHRPDLAAIALEVGFSSHSHMGTAFRRFFGVPPTRVRARTWKRRAG